MIELSSQKIVDLIERSRKGVVHIEFISQSNDVKGSGSGFISCGYLITNNHLYASPIKYEVAITKVKISWQPQINPKSLKSIEISYEKFKACLKTGSSEENCDYAILKIPELDSENLHNLRMVAQEKCIGEEALILGFPLDHKYLVCHRAMISSFYTFKDMVDIIQLDASVNNSNSGGPLIDLVSGDVIGIITRKCTGLSKSFEELQKSFNKICSILENMTKVRMGSLNLNSTIIEVQQQMKKLAEEIYRSANVGIGYAFAVKPILKDIGIFDSFE